MIIVIGYYHMVNTIRHFSSQKCQKIMVHHMDVGGGSRCLVPAGSLTPKQWGESPSYGNFKGNRFKTMGCGETPNNYVGKVLGGWHEWASGGPPKK